MCVGKAITTFTFEGSRLWGSVCRGNAQVEETEDRGTGSDGKAEEEFDFDRSTPHPDQWQTPALWGVADSAPYFHDGGSPTLRAAVERHKGQANSSRQRFESLSTNDQKCLIRFLRTLKAPAPSQLADEMD